MQDWSKLDTFMQEGKYQYYISFIEFDKAKPKEFKVRARNRYPIMVN